MLTLVQAVVLGVVQGITELLPISSDGHLVLVPAWLGWDHLIHAGEDGQGSYLQFIVAVHVATAIALLVYFRADWARIIGGFFRTLRTRRVSTHDERMVWLLALGTIPAAVAGVLLLRLFEAVFASPLAVAALLVVNGCILLGAEALARRRSARNTREFESVNYADAIAIGTAQMPALLGGISRSGLTIAAGLLRGLTRRDAARFSFLLATPAIFGAGILELPSMLNDGGGAQTETLVAALCAGIASFAAVGFLMRFLRTHTLVPFGIYCVLVGAASVLRFR